MIHQAEKTYDTGIYAETPEEAQGLESAGYQKCANQLCQFYISPDVLEQARRYDTIVQCPHCGTQNNPLAAVGAQPTEFTPGGVTRSGLSLGDFAQIGEDLISEMGQIPGYGPIVWWHQGPAGGEYGKSALDGATAEWGVEVKTLNSEVKNKRAIIRPIDRKTKIQAVLNPAVFAEQVGDPKLGEIVDQLHLHGVLGVMVILDMGTSLADVYVREMPLFSDTTTQEVKGVIHFRDRNAKLVAQGLPFTNPLEDPRAQGFVPFQDRQQAPDAEPFGAFSHTQQLHEGPVNHTHTIQAASRYAQHLIARGHCPRCFTVNCNHMERLALDYAGDSHPGSEPQYVNDHFENQNGNTWDMPLEYNFVYTDGRLELTPGKQKHLLSEPGNQGPRARGHVVVDKGNATWLVDGNVGLSVLVKVLEDYTKQMDWVWGGLTNIEGEPINDDFAPKKSLYYWYDATLDHLALSPRADSLWKSGSELVGVGHAGALVCQGSRVDVGTLPTAAVSALLEWATDTGRTVVAGNDNVIKTIEDLEQWNFGDPNKGLTEDNADPEAERSPMGVFKCPDCGELFPRYEQYLQHRSEENLEEEPDDWYGEFPEQEFNAIEDSHFTEQAPRIMPITYVLKTAIKTLDPKDAFDEPVPFIYDIEKDAIYTGYPGARHSDIEGHFTPGGIVEGTYEPGGKVFIKSMTNTPYTVRHMLELWRYQHPEFEVKGIAMRDEQGNETKLASQDEPGQELRRLAQNDPSVKLAHEALKNAGGNVYVVGGAVRDVLQGGDPKDIDLLVRGIPADAVRAALEALPGRVDLTGKDFGVFRYRNAGHETEIALPRRERSTGEGHRDFDVQTDYKMTVEEDLARRDFTVNAIAYDLDSDEFIDPYNGQQDIKDKKLKLVHAKAFDEDPLRVVRALVAHARFGFQPDGETLADMQRSAIGLNHLPAERLQEELDKIFASPNPSAAIKLAHQTGVLKYLLPEVEAAWDYDQRNPHHELPLGEHLLAVLDNTVRATEDPDLRLAALLHDIGKPGSQWTNPDTGFSHFYRGQEGQGADHDTLGAEMAEKRLKALKYPNARTERMRDLIQHHMYPDFSSEKGARKFVNRVGEHADDLLVLRDADRYGKGTNEYQDTKTPVQDQRQLLWDIRNSQQPTDRSQLAINGKDLIDSGIPAGPEMGKILNHLTDLVLEDPTLNNKQTLLDMAHHPETVEQPRIP